MAVSYRTPTPEDVAALSALGSDTFVEAFGDLYAPKDLKQFLEDAYSPDAIAQDMANPAMQYLIAEDAGAMVGYCKIYDGVSLDYDPGGKSLIELKQLYILSSHHGAGVANHMMDWAFDQAANLNADQMLLSVYSENFRAQAFYKRHGFSFHADTIFMVGSHEDHEFLFLKPLK